MAQLRDAQTSALLAEGTAEEVALAADAMGGDDLIFDDVGIAFDPAAVVAAYRERVTGLAGALEETNDADTRDSLQVAITSARQVEAETVPVIVGEARDALASARDAVERATRDA